MMKNTLVRRVPNTLVRRAPRVPSRLVTRAEPLTTRLRERMMRMHQDIAPAAAKPTPSAEAYVSFLTESRQVYRTLETLLSIDPRMQRARALDRDIAFLCERFDIEEPQPRDDGPGRSYADLLTALDPPALECHAYSFYFAHTAGGTMIGNHIQNHLGEKLHFYDWGGEDVKAMLGDARAALDAAAEGWTAEEREVCLEETTRAFFRANALLELLR